MGPTNADIEAARRAGAELVTRTPVLSAGSLSELVGGRVALKAESLQRTGSFKLRGAAARLAVVDAGCGGVVAGSAGNHGQALAYAARARGLACDIFVPVDAAVSKVAAVRAFGATVHQVPGPVDDCVARARAHAEERGLLFVHPFDDPLVVAGQATLGQELLEDVDDLACVVVPVGGGGLGAGVAMAVKRRRPDARVVGVQAAACAALSASLRAGRPVTTTRHATLADGIAIKRPGDYTLPLVEHWLDDVVVVDEDAIAHAMVLLAERAKLVVEGAGATSLAALLTGAVRPPAHGTTIAVLSGGNVDASVLSTVAHWAETDGGRRLRVFTRVDDRPGGLAALLAAGADAGGNVLGVEHVRDAVALHVGETGVELTLATRGHDHGAAICAALEAGGYAIDLQAPGPPVTGRG